MTREATPAVVSTAAPEAAPLEPSLVRYIGHMAFERPRRDVTYDNGAKPIAEVIITFPLLGLTIEQSITAKLETRGGKTMAFPSFSIPRKLRLVERAKEELLTHVLDAFEIWAKDITSRPQETQSSTSQRVRSIDWTI